jgi:hypothetical protein
LPEPVRLAAHSAAVRILLSAAALLSVAACSGADEEDGAANAAAPAPIPSPTGPLPRTPVVAITPVPGRTPAWIGPRPAADDPKTAPYPHLLDQPAISDAPTR